MYISIQNTLGWNIPEASFSISENHSTVEISVLIGQKELVDFSITQVYSMLTAYLYRE